MRISVIQPNGSRQEVPLALSPVSIGSSADCDLAVDDPRVSRRHCELSLTERGVFLRDLRSKNGTFIRDVQIVEALLQPDVIATIGNTHIVLHVVGPPSSLPLSVSGRFGEALGQTVVMRALFAKLEHAAASSEPILLLGESGTGKELLARSVHAASPRRAGPFIVLDCSAIDPKQVEAELFGTGRADPAGGGPPQQGLLEQANSGTLFIKELGELPLEVQSKLHRAIESREVRPVGRSARRIDVRVIAATHRDLRAQVVGKQFREDLYYRLAVIEELVPPLRDRKDDIPLLVERFLSEQSPPRSVADLPPNAMELLRAHSWPGNVRELRNTVARMSLFPDLGQAAINPVSAVPRSYTSVGPLLSLPLRQARGVMVEQFERDYLAEKLRQCGGNKTQAAAAMGVSRQFLHRLLVRYGIGGDDP